MDGQVLKLAHDEWGKYFLRGLNSLRQTGAMCDTTIILKDNISLGAHSCVLAAASPFFKSLLDNTDYPEIDMAEFPQELMKQVLEFIYTGEIIVDQAQVPVLECVAESLNITILAEILKSVRADIHQEDAIVSEDETAVSMHDYSATASLDDHKGDLDASGAQFLPQENFEYIKQEKLYIDDDDEDDNSLTMQDDPTDKDFEPDTYLSAEVASQIVAGMINKDMEPVIITPKYRLYKCDLEKKKGFSAGDAYRTRRVAAGPRKSWKALNNPVKFEDVKVPADGSVPNRAALTLPSTLNIAICPNDETKTGVFTTTKLAKGATFGPYEGEVVDTTDELEQTGYLWKIFQNCKFQYYLDGGNESKANWMRYVRITEHPKEQNLEAYQFNGMLFFRSMKDIQENQELFVRYGNQYSAKITEEPISNDKVHVSVKNSDYDGYKCEECDKLYSDEAIFWKHMRSVHSKPIPVNVYKRMVEEKTVQKEFKTEKENKLEEEDDDDDEEDSDEYLPKTRSKRNTLKKNSTGKTGKKRVGRPRLKLNHDWEINDKNECPICNRVFKTYTLLRQHSAIHFEEKPFKCELCDKSYTQRGNLQMHMVTHSGEKPYICNLCGKGFTRRGELKKHIIRHQGHKPFKCPTCGKGFGDWGNLHRHKVTHTGDKPFKCHVCGKGFTQTSNLRTHIKRHTGEKPHQCSMCNKCFGDLGHLRTHLRRHTGEKPFMCDICGRRFVDKQSMKKHTSRHTDADSFMKRVDTVEERYELISLAKAANEGVIVQ